MRYSFLKILFFSFSLFFAAANAYSANEAAGEASSEKVMIVLDASGSMWGQIDKKSKIEISREVLSKVLLDLDGKAEIGLMVYGHRRKGDCGDIETILPVGKVDHAKYMSVINKISPKGKTPITAALRKSAEALKFSEEKATVILISDGLETCEADPCALAKELEEAGVDFTAHVVAFDLEDKDTASLQCLARETGGKFLSAKSADELSDAIGQVVVAQAPEPEPILEPVSVETNLKLIVKLSAESQPHETAYIYILPKDAKGQRAKAVAKGNVSKALLLKAGKYDVLVQINNFTHLSEVEVSEGVENEVEIILNAGLLKLQASESEGGQPNDKAYFNVFASKGGDRVSRGSSTTIHTLTAGTYYATATIGKALIGKTITIVAGEQTDAFIVLGSGLLKVDVLATEGGETQEAGYIDIYSIEQNANGTRVKITSGNQRNKFSLPAGKYYVTGRVGKAIIGQEIEVVAGKLNQVSLVIGLGIMKVTVIPAEGGKPLGQAYVTIYEAEKQLDGSRKQITQGNQRHKFNLAAGKYYVSAKLGKVKAALDVDIVAGKMIEPTINLNAGSLSITASKGVYVIVYSGEKNLDGTRDTIASYRPQKPIMFPAGKYVIVGKLGDKKSEIEVEVKAGKLNEIQLDL